MIDSEEDFPFDELGAEVLEMRNRGVRKFIAGCIAVTAAAVIFIGITLAIVLS
jgi:hypothetical protein